MTSLEAGIINISVSKDGSAMVIDNRETQAICHFCGKSEGFAVPSLGLLNSLFVYNKPQKWAVIFGGTRREPKRFFICEACAKSICSH